MLVMQKLLEKGTHDEKKSEVACEEKN